MESPIVVIGSELLATPPQDKWFNSRSILRGFSTFITVLTDFQELQILDLSGNYFEGWNENKGISHLFSYPSLSNQNQEEKFKKKKNS